MSELEMRRVLQRGSALLGAVLWLVGCGDDGGDTGDLVERLFVLDHRQAMFECSCDPDGHDCPPRAASARRVDCHKRVADKYAAEIGPELRCEVRKLQAENDCFERADCADTDAWEACYDAGEDCDDRATESHEDEIHACVGVESPDDGSAESGSGGSPGCAAQPCPDAGLDDAASGSEAGSGGEGDGGRGGASGTGGAGASGSGGASGGGGAAGSGVGGAAGAGGSAGQSAAGIGQCPAAGDAHVLLVFDVSASMNELFDDTSRIDAATAAVASTLAEYDPALRVGALFFPTAACVPLLPPPPGGAVAPFSGAPQIAFQTADQFRQLWPDAVPFDSTATVGTPLQEALDRADEALATLAGGEPVAVVLISDGDGNCLPEEGSETALPEEHAAAWAAAGTPLWVVALGQVAAASESIGAIAMAAGTPLAMPATRQELGDALFTAIDTVGCR